MTTFRWGAASHRGQVREVNQDSGVAQDGLFAVADGMGGHRAGEVASRWAVVLLREGVADQGSKNPESVVMAANRVIHTEAVTDRELMGMGTTLCALTVSPGSSTGTLVNVGDSRGYRLRNGELEQLTEDHSLVETLVREGRLRPEDAAGHPQRNIVTRALGVEPLVEVDGWELELEVGDRYLLCSDGLFNEVSDEDITSVLLAIDDPNAASVELVDRANAAGGHDNVTVVLVDVLADDSSEAGGEIEIVGSVAEAGDDEKAPPSLPLADDNDNSSAGGAGAGDDDDDAGATASMKADTADVELPKRSWLRRLLGPSLIVLLIAGAFLGGLWFSGRNNYYLGFDDDNQLVMFRGREGVPFFSPSVHREYGIEACELSDDQLEAIDESGSRDELDERVTDFETSGTFCPSDTDGG